MTLPHTGRALADAAPVPYWLDRPERPDPLPPLTGTHTADLLDVGGGYAGLWTALLAKEADPDRTCCWSTRAPAAGRRPGATAGSAPPRSPTAWPTASTGSPARSASWNGSAGRTWTPSPPRSAEHGIDCDFERTGELAVAVEPYQLDGLADDAELARRYGHDVRLLDRDEVRAEVDSPTYLGGMWDADRVAMLDPAKLAWGLRRAALDLGVRVHEHTRVTGLAADGAALRATTAGGRGRRARRGRGPRRVVLGHQRVPAAAAPAARLDWCRSTTTR